MSVKTFNGGKVDAFLLELYYLHDVLHVSEGMWMFG
jgi:hypothetical protein